MFATTDESAAFVIDVLRAYLSSTSPTAPRCTACSWTSLGLGVMITGESGLGKSELGLELISRGNGLVADDAVDLFRINQTTIEGRCPSCCRTCWKCAASACWTSRPSSARRRCAAHAGCG